MRKFLFNFCVWFSYLFSTSINLFFANIISIIYAGLISRQFGSIGDKFRVYPTIRIIGGKNIEIGNSVTIGRCSILRTACNNEAPLKIGNNVNIGDYCHISSYNGIYICDGVLLGRSVSLIDNNHGKLDYSDIETPPAKRIIESKGAILIEKNVWIGEKATILGGVKIGYNSIIGANAVVTKNIPPYSVVGGIPAKIIKKLK